MERRETERKEKVFCSELESMNVDIINYLEFAIMTINISRASKWVSGVEGAGEDRKSFRLKHSFVVLLVVVVVVCKKAIYLAKPKIHIH